ncbi:MAG: hypothetical protein C5B59_09940 [Bacteroidetes bacterium]|nr:MAG: hypothetical protein C5B59_09940 [Bacteroidota bacterium]
MSTCYFTIQFAGSTVDFYRKIKKAIEENNGSVTGDSSSGTFAIPVLGSTVAGSCAITGQSLMITITKKPVVISCSLIEKYVRGQIAPPALPEGDAELKSEIENKSTGSTHRKHKTKKGHGSLE